jgi:hypothetical protein
MRHFILTGLCLILSLLCIQCNLDGIPGNGVIKKETRDLPAFEKIYFGGGYDVQISCQQPQQIQIECDENLLSHIITKIQDNTLIVSTDTSLSPSKGIHILVNVLTINSFKADGSISGAISNINNESFKLNINGAGDITASGKTNSFSVDANGSCDIDAKQLEAENVRISIDGSGKAGVKVIKSLDVSIEGSGVIEYYGEPSNIQQKINGSGTIEKGKM